MIIRYIIAFLFWLGIIKRPKQYLFAVEARVLLNGTLIKQIPVETWAFSRRRAKKIALRRCKVKTGTTAENMGKDNYMVPLRLYVDNKIAFETKAQVKAARSRDAKFEITKQLQLKAGAAARKDHLIKYNKNSI